MAEMGWRDAVIKVLSESSKPMHYTEIAEVIAEKKLRTIFGANPATSVNVAIADSIKYSADTPFVRVSPGVYWLKVSSATIQSDATPAAEATAPSDAGLINAFGMFWARSSVSWKSKPKILGQQQQNSATVDFCQQTGVYLLYDGREVIYVGRTTDQPLGSRLQQHTVDRLNGRWDRFSWFGIFPVLEDGTLNMEKSDKFNLEMLIATMEALLIEGLEPPQNRKGGDNFRAYEFLQVPDPDLERKKRELILAEMMKKF